MPIMYLSTLCKNYCIGMKPKRMSVNVEGSVYMNDHIFERSACSFVRWGSYSYAFYFGRSYQLCAVAYAGFFQGGGGAVTDTFLLLFWPKKIATTQPAAE